MPPGRKLPGRLRPQRSACARFDGRHRLEPLNADTDGDGIPNHEEFLRHTNPASRDTDGDGMHDDWELARGLDPLTAARGQGGDDNTDGDPFPSHAGFVADTDPMGPLSYLFISDVSHGPPLRMHFHSSARRLYTLEPSTNLTGAPWESVPGETRWWGADDESWMEDDTGATQRFYRIGVELPWTGSARHAGGRPWGGSVPSRNMLP